MLEGEDTGSFSFTEMYRYVYILVLNQMVSAIMSAVFELNPTMPHTSQGGQLYADTKQLFSNSLDRSMATRLLPLIIPQSTLADNTRFLEALIELWKRYCGALAKLSQAFKYCVSSISRSCSEHRDADVLGLVCRM